MSTTEAHPDEDVLCRADDPERGPQVQVLSGREVPLGGPRAMTVRRTLPHRERSFVGAWCFVDHYGPTDLTQGPGMDVPPHPHTGLQTVSWLFEGEIEHRDSNGVHAMVRPGEVNLMTGGRGICHSEVSTSAARTLHGVQLWVALPDADRQAPRDFAHHAAAPVPLPDGAGTARVFLGSLAGTTSPVTTATPLLGAELVLGPGARVALPVDPVFEHGLLVDTGAVDLQGTPLRPGDLGCLDPGCDTLVLDAGPDGARLVLLGGPPFEEEILMWWNFVARTHEEIVAAREEWEAESDRFGVVEGYTGSTQRLPAPAVPQVTLRPRSRRGTRSR